MTFYSCQTLSGMSGLPLIPIRSTYFCIYLKHTFGIIYIDATSDSVETVKLTAKVLENK